LKAEDLDLDLDNIYPPGQRELPDDFTGTDFPHEPYIPFQDLIRGLGINMSQPRTRQEAPATAAPPPDRTQTEKLLKQIAKPIYFLQGDLTNNTVQNLLPDRSRSLLGTDSSNLALTTAGIRAVKHEMRFELITKRMKAICMFVDFSLIQDKRN
jgi:hypothetical protein